MMHPHLIDWFRNPHIHSESKLVEQRWKTAEEYAKKLSRGSVVSLLRMFLFANPDAARIKAFTDELLALDKEFPVEDNTEELRLMAGVVMVATFNNSSHEADAFALGLQAATFPTGRGQPAHPAILTEAKKYLQEEAERQRPGDFDAEPAIAEDTLVAKFKAIAESQATGDAAKIQAAQAGFPKAVAKAIKESNQHLAGQVRRLAEESSLLWWVLSEYSSTLKCATDKVSAPAFAFVAAAEAAERTHILPPPASIGALLNRTLKPCKASTKKTLALEDFLDATDAGFREAQLKKINCSDCADLVPLVTALSKCQEFGEAAPAIKVLPKLCPDFDASPAVSPVEAAQQLYQELMFLKSLTELKTS